MTHRLFPLLISLLLLWVCTPDVALADAYSDGLAAYQAKQFSRAAQQFNAALRENPKNADAMFYLGMAHARNQNYDQARQAFEMVIQTVPPTHELASKARNNISYITKQQITLASNSAKAAQVLTTSLSRTSKDNYLTHVIPSGKVIHFSAAKMPLKVYIGDGLKVPGWHVGMKQHLIYAMRQWQTASRGKVSFVQTYNAANADIIVGWQRNFSDNILGVSPFQMVGDTIVRSDINLAVYYPGSNEKIPDDELKTIAIHELGHAIGIRGHSPYPDDIMYYSKTRHSATLSQRDINTIGMLYKLDADVKSNTSMSTAQTKQYYDFYEKGVKAQTGNRPTDAMAYYRAAMKLNRDMPEAKFNLGALLINEGNKLWRAGNMADAKRSFTEAVQLYSEIMRTPQPPKYTKENLEIAKNNLSLLNKSASR